MPIFTAPKRSLGQGNIFIGMCQEFCSQGGVPGQVSPRPGTPLGPGTPLPPTAVHAGRYGQQAGSTHPTGMHSCANFVFGVPFKIKKTNDVFNLERQSHLPTDIQFH